MGKSLSLQKAPGHLRAKSTELVVSLNLNRGTQYRPKYILVLVMGTPKKVHQILGTIRIECLIMPTSHLACARDYSILGSILGSAY